MPTTLVITSFAASAILLFTVPATAQCTADSDCRGGRVCLRGTCTSIRCSKDVDCPNEGICEAGSCRPAAQAQPGPPAAVAAPPTTSKSPLTGLPDTRPVREESLTGLWVAGVITTSVAYLMTIGLTAGLSQESVRGQAISYVIIPVVGPFVLMGSSINNPQYSAPLAVSGVLQTAGVFMTIIGLATKRPVQPLSWSIGEPSSRVEVSLGPAALPGVHLNGRF